MLLWICSVGFVRFEPRLQAEVGTPAEVSCRSGEHPVLHWTEAVQHQHEPERPAGIRGVGTRRWIWWAVKGSAYGTQKLPPASQRAKVLCTTTSACHHNRATQNYESHLAAGIAPPTCSTRLITPSGSSRSATQATKAATLNGAYKLVCTHTCSASVQDAKTRRIRMRSTHLDHSLSERSMGVDSDVALLESKPRVRSGAIHSQPEQAKPRDSLGDDFAVS